MLRLLQQRTKLSGQIGQMKRRHGGAIYVPERERELVSRLARLSKGQLPARALAAIYREIMSASRSAQGQTPIGYLAASGPEVQAASGSRFGACDRLVAKKTWSELVKSLQSGEVSLALLTGAELSRVVASARWRRELLAGFTIVGDFAPSSESAVALAERVFIVVPRANGVAAQVNRALILIECNSTPNTIKSLLNSMPEYVHHVQAEPLTSRVTLALVRLEPGKAVEGSRVTRDFLKAGTATGIPVSILGIYPGTEDYGG